MKLVQMKNWELIASEEIWGLGPFKKILERDKTKDKTKAHKELLFIYFYCDIKSDYLQLSEAYREQEIKNDIGLPSGWKKDDVIADAIKLYEDRSVSVIGKLYKQASKAASDIGDYLENTKELLDERDVNGKPIYDISKITAAIDKVPKLMANLKAAYKEVVKEEESLEGRKKGSQTMGMFEDGL